MTTITMTEDAAYYLKARLQRELNDAIPHAAELKRNGQELAAKIAVHEIEMLTEICLALRNAGITRFGLDYIDNPINGAASPSAG